MPLMVKTRLILHRFCIRQWRFVKLANMSDKNEPSEEDTVSGTTQPQHSRNDFCYPNNTQTLQRQTDPNAQAEGYVETDDDSDHRGDHEAGGDLDEDDSDGDSDIQSDDGVAYAGKNSANVDDAELPVFSSLFRLVVQKLQLRLCGCFHLLTSTLLTPTIYAIF